MRCNFLLLPARQQMTNIEHIFIDKVLISWIYKCQMRAIWHLWDYFSRWDGNAPDRIFHVSIFIYILYYKLRLREINNSRFLKNINYAQKLYSGEHRSTIIP